MNFEWLPQVFEAGKWVVGIVGTLGIFGGAATFVLPENTTTAIGYFIGLLNKVLLRQKSLKDTKAGRFAKTAACFIEGWYQALKSK